MQPVFSFFRTQFSGALRSWSSLEQIAIEREIREVLAAHAARAPGHLMQYGFKAYSQCDEDGILQELFRRIGERSQTFIEIGSGNGLENNTHYLLLKGWRGCWIDGDERNVREARDALADVDPKVLSIARERIDPANVERVMAERLAHLGIADRDLDLLSIDIDGNDYHVLERLSDCRPRVLVAEYNAKFPPPLEMAVRYDPAHRWDRSDYFGASLASLYRLLVPRGYALLCCNVSGANAFFVRRDAMGEMPEPSIEASYQPPRYHLGRRAAGHPASYGFLRARLGRRGAGA